MSNSLITQPLIIFYNPQCAKAGYQRLPAAILQVASLIEDLYSYEIIDANLRQFDDYPQLIIDKVKQGVRYLAISIMPGPQLTSTVSDLRKIKDACPELTVIVGGYFPLNHTEVCVKDPDIDYAVVGPGEETFKELITTLEANENLVKVRGLAFVREGKMIQTSKRSPTNPNDLPRYPYHKLNTEDYIAPTFLGSRTLSHHSSFGCPFFCNFCAVVALAGGKWFGEKGERLGELAQIMVDKWQINALEFHDNNFFTSEKRVQSFCQQLIKRQIKLNWWGEGRVDTLLKYKEKTWELMRNSGLKMVFLGAESGDDETLQRMNKGGTQSANSALLLAAKMRDFEVIPEFSFILGNPPTPKQDVQKTIAFIRQIKKINPKAEIIMYRYDPVPIGGEMFDAVTKLGFKFPASLEEWSNPKWRKIQRRTTADVPWLTAKGQQYISDFQTVLNAFHPTATSRHIPPGSWRYWLLKSVSGIRYHLRFYKHPVELTWLQKKLAYQRPEISGF